MPVTRPAVYPEWAESDYIDPVSGQPNVIEPAADIKDTGWTKHQKPPRQYFNWLGRFTSQWIKYFDKVLGQADGSFVVSNMPWAYGTAPINMTNNKVYVRRITDIAHFTVDITAQGAGTGSTYILSVQFQGTDIEDMFDEYPALAGRAFVVPCGVCSVDSVGAIRVSGSTTAFISNGLSPGLGLYRYVLHSPYLTMYDSAVTRTVIQFAFNMKDIPA